MIRLKPYFPHVFLDFPSLLFSFCYFLLCFSMAFQPSDPVKPVHLFSMPTGDSMACPYGRIRTGAALQDGVEDGSLLRSTAHSREVFSVLYSPCT